jgi:hypothetical protein
MLLVSREALDQRFGGVGIIRHRHAENRDSALCRALYRRLQRRAEGCAFALPGPSCTLTQGSTRRRRTHARPKYVPPRHGLDVGPERLLGPYGAGDPLPAVYVERFRTQIYNERITYPGVWNKVVVRTRHEDRALAPGLQTSTP